MEECDSDSSPELDRVTTACEETARRPRPGRLTGDELVVGIAPTGTSCAGTRKSTGIGRNGITAAAGDQAGRRKSNEGATLHRCTAHISGGGGGMERSEVPENRCMRQWGMGGSAGNITGREKRMWRRDQQAGDDNRHRP